MHDETLDKVEQKLHQEPAETVDLDEVTRSGIYKTIQELAKELKIEEAAAVTIYGQMMRRSNGIPDLKTVIATLQLIAKKNIEEMSHDERIMLISAGYLVRKHAPYVAGKMPGRNDICPCGSGMKFKKCCIGLAHAHELEKRRAL